MEKKFIDHCRARFFRLVMVAVCLLASAGLAYAQDLTVKGTVTSATDGEPLVGVTVQVKGSSNGTATDLDGNYSIKAAKGAVLSFSYIGMKAQEIKVTSDRPSRRGAS